MNAFLDTFNSAEGTEGNHSEFIENSSPDARYLAKMANHSKLALAMRTARLTGNNESKFLNICPSWSGHKVG